MSNSNDRDYRVRGRSDAVEGLLRTDFGRSADPSAMLQSVLKRIPSDGDQRPRLFRLKWMTAAALLLAAFLGFTLGRNTSLSTDSENTLGELDPMHPQDELSDSPAWSTGTLMFGEEET